MPLWRPVTSPAGGSCPGPRGNSKKTGRGSHRPPPAPGGAGLSETARELVKTRKGMPQAAARTREEIAAFFGDMTLVEPGLTDAWSWRPDSESVLPESDPPT